jgi:hypothetical protein
VIRFNEEGPDSLVNKSSPGAPGKLTEEHKAFLTLNLTLMDVPLIGEPTLEQQYKLWPLGFVTAAPTIDVSTIKRVLNPYPNDPAPYPYEPIEQPGAQLIYRSATPLERALVDVDAERLLRIHAEVIIAQWDPYKISLHNLPFLAWGLGVNLWENGWRETRRRLYPRHPVQRADDGGPLGDVPFSELPAPWGECLQLLLRPAASTGPQNQDPQLSSAMRRGVSSYPLLGLKRSFRARNDANDRAASAPSRFSILTISSSG